MDFQKFEIFTAPMMRRPNMCHWRHCVKFLAYQSNVSRDMTIFLFFNMVAIRHLGYLEAENFSFWSVSPVCITMPNFVPIGQTIVEILWIRDFSRRWPSAIWDLFNAFGPPIWWSL